MVSNCLHCGTNKYFLSYSGDLQMGILHSLDLSQWHPLSVVFFSNYAEIFYSQNSIYS